MASKEANLQKQVECPICLEQYKEPKVLSCLHSYCKTCLQKYVTKTMGEQYQIECPECRQETEVPEGDLGKLQVNFWVNNLIDLLKVSTSDEAQKLMCENCDSGDVAVSRCPECCVFMCKPCVEAHGRMRNLKNHHMVSIDELKSGSPKSFIKPVHCEKHTDEILKLFCETCEKPICRDCTMVEHRSHDYLFIADAASREKDLVRELLHETKDKVSILEEGVKSVEVMEERVQARVTAVAQDIEELKEKQMRALEEVFANLKHEADTMGRAKIKQLQVQKDGLLFSLASAVNSVEFTERILRDGGDVELLSMKKQLATNLSKLNLSAWKCDPCEKDTIKLEKQLDVWYVAGNIARVVDAHIALGQCTVTFTGGETGVIYDTLAGQTREFSIVLRDDQGNKMREEQVQVKVFRPGSHEGTAVEVADNNDGTYSFAFQPVQQGTHQLHVMVSNHHINGSPYVWNILPKPPMLVQIGSKSFQTEALYKRLGALSWKIKFLPGKIYQTHMHSRRQRPSKITQTKEIGVYFVAGDFSKWTITSGGCKQHGSERFGIEAENSNIKVWEDGDEFALFLDMNLGNLKIVQLRTSLSEVFEGIEGNIAPFISPNNCDYFSFDV